MAAFADPPMRAVLATIGGDDQIAVLPFWTRRVGGPETVRWLQRQHQPAELAVEPRRRRLSRRIHHGPPRPGRWVHPVSAGSLRAALFTGRSSTLHPVDVFSEDELDWADPASLGRTAVICPARGGSGTSRTAWSPRQPGAATWRSCTGISPRIGGSARSTTTPAASLLLETSEEMPSAVEVFRMLRNAGERGLLAQFPAVLVGHREGEQPERGAPREERDGTGPTARGILRALDRYNPAAMVVFDVDIGHTDPQWVLPYGGTMTVDGPARSISATY